MMSRYLAMWCIDGLESIINLTEIEQNNIISALKGEKITHSNPIHYMILRAKFNSQRHYEIYMFDSEMDKHELDEMFESDPQSIVDIIRLNGQELYSDRIRKDKVLIR